MFKLVSSMFKTAPVSVIPVTREVVQKRSSLCSKLQHIYKAQIGLLSNALPRETVDRIPLLKYYTAFGQQYLDQLSELENGELEKTEFSEERFLALINKQLDSKVLELESINQRITPSDLRLLDENYSKQIDAFFSHFHTNRIAASFELKEYIYPEPLLQVHDAKSVVDQAVKTTSQMLTLNDYPVPKFKQVSAVDGDLSVYCIAPHVVHIMFELFKNATLPSITHGKPILISIYGEEADPSTIVFKIKDNGGGMPPSMVKKIWQFHYTTTQDNERDPIHGFGMGLPLCKVFAEFNDGSLTLVNEEGDGVTVYLKLPIGVRK